MKCLDVFLLIALTFVLTTVRDTESKKMTIEEVKAAVKGLRKVCARKNDTPKELLDGQHRGEFPKDERLTCYMKCILTTTKSMKNDQIMYDWFLNNARLMLVEEYYDRVESSVTRCREEVTATDGCEVAWEFGKCIYATDPEVSTGVSQPLVSSVLQRKNENLEDEVSVGDRLSFPSCGSGAQ
ncbi:odorant binding protein 6 [Ptiloglossa arizonensis]|uniref:odorant binding protein 6 n=1 Tax=Ptiloglossa arizonensis TaxID=3350558 RepID=UPI003F9EC2A3